MARALGTVVLYRMRSVCHSQHAEGEVHGLMETAFSNDDEDEEAILKDSNKVGNKKGERDPCVLAFQAKGAQKNEEQMASNSVVGGCHAQDNSLGCCTGYGHHLFFLPKEVNWIGVREM